VIPKILVELSRSVQVLPYRWPAPPDAAGTEVAGGGSCAGKHALLAERLHSAGLQARPLLVVGPLAPRLWPDLVAVAAGLLEVHECLTVLTPWAGPVTVDVTWHPAAVDAGLPGLGDGWTVVPTALWPWTLPVPVMPCRGRNFVRPRRPCGIVCTRVTTEHDETKSWPPLPVERAPCEIGGFHAEHRHPPSALRKAPRGAVVPLDLPQCGTPLSGWKPIGLRVDLASSSPAYGRGMPDAIFEDPRLVAIYDPLDPNRSDLDVYAAIVDELGARRVLDVGCGTGTFALLLAERGLEVTGVDPAAGSLGAARAKPGAEQVRWVHGDATALPLMQADLATMTGNVAQAIIDPSDWEGTLRGVHEALRPGGHLVFETRDPACRGWQGWNRAASYKATKIQGVGVVQSWVELTDVSGPLVSFRWTWVFGSDGQVLTSDSTLRFRERDEVCAALLTHGYAVDEVRDAPDRPGQEFVFFARRPA